MRILPSLILACAILGVALILRPIPCDPPSVIIETPEPPLADPFVHRIAQPLSAPTDQRLIERVIDERLQKHFEAATEMIRNEPGDKMRADKTGGPVVAAIVGFIVETAKSAIVTYLQNQLWAAVKAHWMPIAG